MKKLLLVAILLFTSVVVQGQTNTPTNTPTFYVLPTATPTVTGTRSPTVTRTPTRTRTPTQPPTPRPKHEGYLSFSDDFNQYYHNEYQCWSGPWELWLRDPAALYSCTGDATDNWPYIRRNNYPTTIASDRAWRPGFLTTKVYCDDEAAMFVIEMSKQEGSPDAEPEDWADILVEVDVFITPTTTFGIMWAIDVADDNRTPTMYKRPTSANIALFGPWQPGNSTPTFPNFDVTEMVGDRGGYYGLYKITADIPLAYKFNRNFWQVVQAPTKISPSSPYSYPITYLPANLVYVFRLTSQQERLVLQYQIRYAPTMGVPPVYWGCKTPDDNGVCTESTMNDCWCTIVNTGVLFNDGIGDPGAVGLYISGSPGASCAAKTDPQAQQSFDNVKIYSFRPIPPPPTPTRTPTLQQ